MDKINVMNFVKENIEDGVIFNLGCKSGWIFIGTKDEWLRYVDVLSEDYKKWYQEKVDDADKKCSIFKLVNCRRIDTRKVDKKKGKRETDAEWRSRIHKKADELHEAIDKRFDILEKEEARLKNFTSFKTRNAIDYYVTDVEKIPSIIIDGDDVGIFWFRSEFEKYYKGGRSIKKLAFKSIEEDLAEEEDI